MKKLLKILMLSAFLMAGYATFSAPTAHAQTQASFAGNEDELVCMIDQIIETTKELEEYITLQDNAQYIRPLKVLAGRTKAMLLGRGSHSQRSLAMVDLFVKKIRSTSTFIQRHYEINATFEIAIQMDTLTEQLDKAID